MKGNHSKEFSFDAIGSPNCSQSDFFRLTGVTQLLDYAIHGYSTAIFAYGQTGSGKTYTMSGDENIMFFSGAKNQFSRIKPFYEKHETCGIIPRAIQYLGERITRNNSISDGISRKIKCGYLEIYNEKARDLLNASSLSLAVSGTTSTGFHCPEQNWYRVSPYAPLLPFSPLFYLFNGIYSAILCKICWIVFKKAKRTGRYILNICISCHAYGG